MAGNEFEAFLAHFNPDIQALALEARALILDTIPGIQEIVDPPSGIVAYGFSRKYAGLVCAIAPYPRHLNLMLSQGAILPDPDGLLVGTGKRARHIKIQTAGDLQQPGVRALLLAGVDRVRS